MSKGYQAYADALLTSEPSGENAAVLQHIGLVHKTALHIKARLPDHVELEELVQIGMVGLLEAAKSFDASREPIWAHSPASVSEELYSTRCASDPRCLEPTVPISRPRNK